MQRRLGVLLTLSAASVACGDNWIPNNVGDASVVDVGPPKPCWELVDPIPMGTGILGTGTDAFEPMPAMLPLQYGAQAGFNLVANVQMRGLLPGNPDDIFDPSNPRTRILAYFDDTGIPLNRLAHCPYRVGFKPVGAQTYEFSGGVAIIFQTCWRAEHLIGHKIRIKLEILDSNHGYTTDERVVTAAAPPPGSYPTGEGLPGCPLQ